MTFNEAAGVVAFVLAGFPAQRQRMHKDDVRMMVEFYAAGLEDIDVGVAKLAVTRLGMTSKFIPNVAEIREAVGIVHHGEQSPAAVAWGEVHKFMRTKGSWRTPGVDFEFADPIAAQIVRAFGWEDICASTNQDSLRARFSDAYTAMSKQARTTAALSAGGKNPELPAARSRARIEREGEPKVLGMLVSAVTPTGDDNDN